MPSNSNNQTLDNTNSPRSVLETEDRDRDGQPGAASTNNNFFAPSSSSWTDIIPRTSHNALFLECDFGPTALGPLQDWDPILRVYASMLFADSRGAGIYWGPKRTAFYNEKFAVCCGSAHPFLMGRGFEDAFPTLWDQMRPIFDQAAATAKTVDVDNMALFLVRNGYLEETYFIGQFLPLRGPSGEVEGFYNTIDESTSRVLYERRRRIVDAIASIPPRPQDETLLLIIDALRKNPKDIAMAMLFSFDDLAGDGDVNLHFRSGIGVPAGHPCAPQTTNLKNDHNGLVPFFRKVAATGRHLVLSQIDGSLQAAGDLFTDISWCGFGEASRDIVVLPLSSGGNLLGFYVQGTNPRRAYDEATELSIIDIARQIEVKWIASLSIEQAKQREEALERRATDSERHLRHMAQGAPLGMLQVTPEHTIQWANDQYYDITGHDRSNPDVSGFWKIIAEEDTAGAQESLRSLLEGKGSSVNETSRSVREIRLNRRWTPPVQEDEETEKTFAWILAVSYPLMENDKVKLVMAYISDISHQKWAEKVQTRNANAATLAKRRQEEFIDCTSHEMRNPLTAIIQLTDGIAKSLREEHPETIDAYRAYARDNLDSANTILACAAHQKRVIDDVLMLSRLESHMLSITPVAEQASKMVSDTVKMFDGEVAMNGVDIEAVRDHSYDSLDVDFVLIDRSRLMQILINLISNSIKFTSAQAVRRISVVYGAQARRPPKLDTIYGDLEWIQPADKSKFVSPLPPANSGERPLYLYFRVQDTGSGMTFDETQRLFQRFTQATPKTHIKYGGNGLGLYICRELAEKQGGAIGVASRSDEGSVFAFYIETRAATPPSEASSRQPPQTHARTMSGRPNLPQRVLSPRDDAESPFPSSSKLDLDSPVPQQKEYRILLVEDNLVNQKVLANQLRRAKCTVTVANQGADALEILKSTGRWRKSDSNGAVSPSDTASTAVEVVLMDWEMPVMNGLECCKRIRKIEAEHTSARRLPIIATTANVRDEQKSEALAAGMDDILNKPFTTEDLLKKIQEVFANMGLGDRRRDAG